MAWGKRTREKKKRLKKGGTNSTTYDFVDRKDDPTSLGGMRLGKKRKEQMLR